MKLIPSGRLQMFRKQGHIQVWLLETFENKFSFGNIKLLIFKIMFLSNQKSWKRRIMNNWKEFFLKIKSLLRNFSAACDLLEQSVLSFVVLLTIKMEEINDTKIHYFDISADISNSTGGEI